MSEEETTLEEIESLFSEDGYICLGHGTGRSGNNDEIINLIFQNGLRTKDNSLYFTTQILSTPTKEIIINCRKNSFPIPSIENLKKSLNNWPHLNSKKIILIRIPTKYINYKGDMSDLDSERYGAFMNSVIQENGTEKNYLDSRFIIGCYDVDTERVKLNKKFEKVLSDDTKKKLKDSYLKALKKTKDRLERTKSALLSRKGMNNTVTEYNYDFDNYSDSDLIWNDSSDIKK